MKKMLLAGTTGYLESYIAKELQKMAFAIRVIVRNMTSLKDKDLQLNEVVKVALTRPDTITPRTLFPSPPPLSLNPHE